MKYAPANTTVLYRRIIILDREEIFIINKKSIEINDVIKTKQQAPNKNQQSRINQNPKSTHLKYSDYNTQYQIKK